MLNFEKRSAYFRSSCLVQILYQKVFKDEYFSISKKVHSCKYPRMDETLHWSYLVLTVKGVLSHVLAWELHCPHAQPVLHYPRFWHRNPGAVDSAPLSSPAISTLRLSENVQAPCTSNFPFQIKGSAPTSWSQRPSMKRHHSGAKSLNRHSFLRLFTSSSRHFFSNKGKTTHLFFTVTGLSPL